MRDSTECPSQNVTFILYCMSKNKKRLCDSHVIETCNVCACMGCIQCVYVDVCAPACACVCVCVCIFPAPSVCVCVCARAHCSLLLMCVCGDGRTVELCS